MGNKIALVVDDTADIRLLVRRLLEPAFDVIEALEGSQALEELRSHRSVDLAVVDWNMPEGMSGIDFVRAVRSNSAYDGMRIMMLTSEQAKPSVERALKAGADEYLMKPFSPDMFLKKLDLLGLSPRRKRP
jgi:two-component system, chemotaxis family, chemotaxis protein CheY